MRSFFLTAVIFVEVAFLAYHYRSELRIAEPIDSLATRIVLPALGYRKLDFDWPPKLNQPYPDLQLIDQQGNLTRLSDYRGKIILIEPIGMPCRACQAFCGGQSRGGFAGIPPQAGLPSMKELARTYGGFDLSDDRIVVVHLLLYSLDMQAPSPADARAWAEHFGIDRSKNHIVLAGLPTMISQASYAMIPGLQLVDRDFILRVDATGRSGQRHNLYRDLLPRVGAMLSRK